MQTSKRKSLKKIAKSGAVLGGISLMPAKWTKPVIDSILIPAHAQTSPEATGCSADDVVGIWDFVISNDNGPADNVVLTFDSGGTGSFTGDGFAGSFAWSLSDNSVSMEISPDGSSGSSIATMTLSSSCDSGSGTSQDVDGAGNVEDSTTFTATKR